MYLFIYLFHFSICFEQPSAHRQENQLYQYIICYVSLCVGDCPVCRSLFYTRLPACEDGTDSVPKRRHINFRRRGIT
jgi:hypothetical protein